MLRGTFSDMFESPCFVRTHYKKTKKRDKFIPSDHTLQKTIPSFWEWPHPGCPDCNKYETDWNNIPGPLTLSGPNPIKHLWEIWTDS